MIPQNNSDEEILIYSDFLIDTDKQELSDWIKEDIENQTPNKFSNSWTYNNVGHTWNDLSYLGHEHVGSNINQQNIVGSYYEIDDLHEHFNTVGNNYD